MPTIILKVKTKRPIDATPERAQELRAIGISIADIARLWHISRQRVYKILAKAKGMDKNQTGN